MSPTPSQRDAVDDLLGRRSTRGASLVVSLVRVEEVLRQAEIADSLAEALEALGGPLVDRRAEQQAAREAREEMWARARAAPVVARRPELLTWLHELRSLGLLTRAAKRGGVEAADLLETVLRIVGRLPEDGTQLAILAAETTGDAHGLDPGQPLMSLVLRAATHLARWKDVPYRSADLRRLWADVGVLCDPLSPHVLILGLRPRGGDLLSRHLREAAEIGEPRKVTLREIARADLRFGPHDVVSVCENVTVMACVADRLGASFPPLICTEGRPSSATIVLLRSIARHGARVRFHCDFDWGGISIGNQLVEAVGAQPWLFDAKHYRAAVDAAVEGRALEGVPVSALWDSELTNAIESHGLAIFEESLVDELVRDLSCVPYTRRRREGRERVADSETEVPRVVFSECVRPVRSLYPLV